MGKSGRPMRKMLRNVVCFWFCSDENSVC